MDKEMIIFDLDGTLVESKSVPSYEMCEVFVELLTKYKIAVISGCSWKQCKEQFVDELLEFDDWDSEVTWENLYLLPTSGASMYNWRDLDWDSGGWECWWSNELGFSEKVKIYSAWEKVSRKLGLLFPAAPAEIVEDRGAQLTFSMCGQEALLDVKRKWDPDQKIRIEMIKFMKPLLPEFEVRIGGTTSIDVTRRGIDKKYGINKLLDHLQIPPNKVLFVGDALYEGGNDEAAKETGVTYRETSGPAETKKIIEELLCMEL